VCSSDLYGLDGVIDHTATTTYEYDAYGNVVEICAMGGGVNAGLSQGIEEDFRIVENSFKTRFWNSPLATTGRQILNLPKVLGRVTTVDAQEAEIEVQATRFFYDSSNDIEDPLEWGPTNITKVSSVGAMDLGFSYDTFGNLLEIRNLSALSGDVELLKKYYFDPSPDVGTLETPIDIFGTQDLNISGWLPTRVDVAGEPSKLIFYNPYGKVKRTMLTSYLGRSHSVNDVWGLVSESIEIAVNDLVQIVELSGRKLWRDTSGKPLFEKGSGDIEGVKYTYDSKGALTRKDYGKIVVTSDIPDLPNPVSASINQYDVDGNLEFIYPNLDLSYPTTDERYLGKAKVVFDQSQNYFGELEKISIMHFVNDSYYEERASSEQLKDGNEIVIRSGFDVDKKTENSFGETQKAGSIVEPGFRQGLGPFLDGFYGTDYEYDTRGNLVEVSGVDGEIGRAHV